MSIVEKGNALRIPVYSQDSDSAVQDISWSQSGSTKTAKYYIVKAKNKSKSDSDVLLYVQDRFYKNESSPDYIGKIPGATKEENNWVVTISDRFQYGQKNAAGEGRWVALHDKSNKPYQHRFLITTLQGKVAEWAKTLATAFGAGDIAQTVHKLGSTFIGHYLHTF